MDEKYNCKRDEREEMNNLRVLIFKIINIHEIQPNQEWMIEFKRIVKSGINPVIEKMILDKANTNCSLFAPGFFYCGFYHPDLSSLTCNQTSQNCLHMHRSSHLPRNILPKIAS